MATIPWDPNLSNSISSNVPNPADVDGADWNPGFTVSAISPYKSPDTRFESADVWIPGTFLPNGFVLTSWHYPLMPTDTYRFAFSFLGGYTLGIIKDLYSILSPIFLNGSLGTTTQTLPTQPTEQYRVTGVTFVSGSLVVMVISLATQPTDQYFVTGVTFLSGGSLVVMVISLATQPTDQYDILGVTFLGGSLT